MPTVINSYLQDGAKSRLLTLISQFQNEGKFLPCPRQLDFPFPPRESARVFKHRMFKNSD